MERLLSLLRRRIAIGEYCEDSDEKAQLLRMCSVGRKPREQRRHSTPKANLKDMIRAEVVEAGEGVISVQRRDGTLETGDLTLTGDIVWNEQVFKSPSKFELTVKRLDNPFKISAAGYTAVMFRGKRLEGLRTGLAPAHLERVSTGAVVKRRRTEDGEELFREIESYDADFIDDSEFDGNAEEFARNMRMTSETVKQFTQRPQNNLTAPKQPVMWTSG